MASPNTPHELWKAIAFIHYAYPLSILIYFVIASLVSICTLQTLTLKVKDQPIRRDVILWLVTGVLLEYIAEAILNLVQSLIRQDWFPPEDAIVYVISSIIVWGIQTLSLVDTQFPVWHPYCVSWVAGIILETFLVVVPNAFYLPTDAFEVVLLSIQCLRVGNLIVLPCLYLALRNRKDKYDNVDEERQSLLRSRLAPRQSDSEDSNQGNKGYGAAGKASKMDSEDLGGEEDGYLNRQRECQERIEKHLKEDGSWWTYAKGFAAIYRKALQFRAALVGFCLLASNALNVLAPRQLGLVTDALVSRDIRSSWIAIGVYAALTFIKSNACIGWLQFWLWQPVQQYSYNALNTAAHAHVMSLSSDFHEGKQPAEIHSTVTQDTSVTSLVDTVCFRLVPMFLDLILVFSYLYYLFGPYMALDLGVTTIFYLYTTTKLVSMSVQPRHAYITNFRKERIWAYSTVGNWRVATYFNNIPYEEDRYASNVKDYLQSDRQYRLFTRVLSAAQGLIMTLGLLVGCWLAVYQVMRHIRSPGDFVALVSYWAQLKGPLSLFSNMYKDISESMMDAERLLELFQTKPNVIDAKGAKSLMVSEGEVQFENVTFAYDARKPTLKGINFKISGGSTVALVGETGSGKSTILKLLNRFYDIKDGSIQIDNQDIRDVTLKSLREIIGVVPQDPTLFNDSIMNNIRYSRSSATDDEVYQACRLASVHDKILDFPDGYNSKVGNHGIKLSGGEQQRIAIARAMLKRPQIILLDEATSSVDTETEQLIQEAFENLCKGRTTFIVAHRLSTIMRADRIMVVKNGEIIEDGSHIDLLKSRGKYFNLWSKQILDKPVVRKDNGSNSQLSHNQDANLVNDLNPATKSELTELLKKKGYDDAKNNHLGGHGYKSPERVDSAQSPGTPRLKPDAPEFVPRHLRTDSEGARNFVKTDSKQGLKERYKIEKDQKKQEKEERKNVSVAKRAAGKERSPVEQSEETEGDLSKFVLSESNKDIDASASDTKDDRPQLRRPRFCSRRHQSKSEPNHHAQEPMDGTEEIDDTTLQSSEETQALLAPEQMQNRRSSAPSDPPVGQYQTRSFCYLPRPRRSRHWRIKNRTGESSVSTALSSAYQDQSADDIRLPLAPATSPAEQGTVRFAPGF